MNSSVKIFIASIIIFACSVGFFFGATYMRPCLNGNPPCTKANSYKQEDFKPIEKRDFKKQKKYRQAMMDSILQVTPEQKTALDLHRNKMDSSFKILHQQKNEAEKELKLALDSNKADQINAIKAKILAIQESLLDNRINGINELNSILTKEQIIIFHDFKKKRFEKKHRARQQ